jgi:ankyrin repeat protein
MRITKIGTRTQHSTTLPATGERLGAGADVNAKNSWSKTALHYAAEYGRHLLGAGSDVNAKDSYFETPLNYAIDNGKREVEALLRQHGAE